MSSPSALRGRERRSWSNRAPVLPGVRRRPPSGIARLIALSGAAPALLGIKLLIGSGGEGEVFAGGITLIVVGGLTTRDYVGIVADHLLVELQLSARSDAQHYAQVLGHRLDVPVNARRRPLLQAGIGWGGAYFLLALLGIMGLGFWAMIDSGGPALGLALTVLVVALQYPIARLTMRPAVRRWIRSTYAV